MCECFNVCVSLAVFESVESSAGSVCVSSLNVNEVCACVPICERE